MVDRVTRFGVSMPEKLVKRFDVLIGELGYTNRSKAISDAVNEFIIQKKTPKADNAVGTISYIYDHHFTDVNNKLVRLQHGFEKNIRSMMHSHIDHKICIEVLIVAGSTIEIKKLFGGISAIRGVNNCKLSLLN